MLDPDNDSTRSEQDEVAPTTSDATAAAPDEQAAAAPPAKKATRAPRKTAAKRTPAKRAAGAPAADTAPADETPAETPADDAPAVKKAPARRTRKTAAAAEPVAEPVAPVAEADDAASAPTAAAPLFQAPAVTTTVRKRATRRAAPPSPVETPAEPTADPAAGAPDEAGSAQQPPAEAGDRPARKTAKRAARKPAATPDEPTADATDEPTADATPAEAPAEPAEKPKKKSGKKKAAKAADETGTSATEAPAEDGPRDEAEDKPKKKSGKKKSGKKKSDAPVDDEQVDDDSTGPETDAPAAEDDESSTSEDGSSDDESDESGTRRRPRRRGGRRRRRGGGGDDSGGEGSETTDADTEGSSDDSDAADDDGDEAGSGSRRRRRRRRSGGGGNGNGGGNGGNGNGGGGNGGGERRSRSPEDEITVLAGSTRLEAKKQRRREGREAGRRRAPIVSEAEFLARRESVERTMVVRQREDLTQIAVLEDKVLVEHYVSRESQTSMIGNVYLGRVQNVLPSMEAAFIDIGKGRNAVLYAGEVNWKSLGHKEGQPRTVEAVLSPGQPVLVQVSKDPIGHKGARLTSQVSLPGRFLVYVPDGTTSGISRKLPEGERGRLKTLLKEIVPDSAGVIVRTAAEGASEEELTKDVERLTARWSDIEAKVAAGGGKGGAPQLLYGEPDLTLKVVRDLFTEDFARLVVQGDDAWDLVDNYVSHVAPELRERLEHHVPGDDGVDLFAVHRIDEQIAKGLDRKVWLPSGGSLVIDRTEAMTVVDVNTGKFTGSGGNLEETVTKNNLEAAEEIVRQLRLRDIGGIIVVDFIDMVLESNRDLVLRRLVECLGRDRTRHQVAEVTSLGLVQMTRKRIGTGLLEAFSEECTHCKGRGLTLHDHPVEPSTPRDDDQRRGGGRRGRGGNGGGGNGNGGNGNGGRQGSSQGNGGGSGAHAPSPADVAAMARPENADKAPVDAQPDEAPDAQTDALDNADRATETAAAGPVPDTSVADRHDDRSGPTAPSPAAQTADDAGPGDVAERAVETAAAGPGDVHDDTAAPSPEETPQAPAEPRPARVTSRRRTARRPAGPPADAPAAEPEVVADPTPGDAPVVEDESAPVEAAGDPGTGEDQVPPVPVKRRGSRRR